MRMIARTIVFLYYLAAVQRGRSAIILLLYAHSGLVIWLRLKESLGFTVSSHFHLLQLNVLPFVESD